MRQPNQRALFFSLNTLLRQLLRNDIELPRVVRTASLLMLGGSTSNSMPEEIESRVVLEQHADGGWVGPDDTMWCLLYLKLVGHSNGIHFHKGLEYLRSSFQRDLGWGRSARDIPRIPVTGRILFFFPELCESRGLNGLLSLWERERNSLTYKAASVLMACSSATYPFSNQIVSDAWQWLCRQQNPDGGFGPWLNHPAGSDIFCTSYAILGLLCYRNEQNEESLEKTIRSAVEWMAAKQLDIGLWGYHQIEDGASWGLYALHEVEKVTEKSDG